MRKHTINHHLERPRTHDAEQRVHPHGQERKEDPPPMSTKKRQEVTKASFFGTLRVSLTQHLSCVSSLQKLLCGLSSLLLLPRFAACVRGSPRDCVTLNFPTPPTAQLPRAARRLHASRLDCLAPPPPHMRVSGKQWLQTGVSSRRKNKRTPKHRNPQTGPRAHPGNGSPRTKPGPEIASGPQNGLRRTGDRIGKTRRNPIR